MKLNAACFIGHREINETKELKVKVLSIIENLIAKKIILLQIEKVAQKSPWNMQKDAKKQSTA